MCTGSIGSSTYDDIAIFDESFFEVIEAKFFIDEKWTEYMIIEQAEEFFEQKFNQDE